ncbi:MAG: hypothetical protein ACRDNH_00625 [Gaiellaceae bacterium]
MPAAEKTDSPVMKASAQHALAETLNAAGELPAALAAAREAARLCTIVQRNLLKRRASTLAEQIEQSLARAEARTSVA